MDGKRQSPRAQKQNKFKMAARANKRVSKGCYKDLNDVSTVDFLSKRTSAKKGRFYEIERVLSQRRMKGKVNIASLLCRFSDINNRNNIFSLHFFVAVEYGC